MNKTKREVDQQDGSESDWRSGKNKGCSRYSMYVDFKEIGWQDWYDYLKLIYLFILSDHLSYLISIYHLNRIVAPRGKNLKYL